MGKSIKIDNVYFGVNSVGSIPIDTTQYTDITETFITTYNFRQGYYSASSYTGTGTTAQRFVSFDLVPKTEGEFIVVIPPIITGFRLITTDKTTWNNTGYRSSEYSNPNNVSVKAYSTFILTLKEGAARWALNMGVASGSITTTDVINSGFKVYKKN